MRAEDPMFRSRLAQELDAQIAAQLRQASRPFWPIAIASLAVGGIVGGLAVTLMNSGG